MNKANERNKGIKQEKVTCKGKNNTLICPLLNIRPRGGLVLKVIISQGNAVC